MGTALKKRLMDLERRTAQPKAGVIVVDARPGQSWAEAKYLAMLNVTGPAVYVPAKQEA